MSVASDVNRIVTGYIAAQEATEYAGAVTMEMQQISGDDYEMVWTAAYDGEYPPKD